MWDESDEKTARMKIQHMINVAKLENALNIQLYVKYLKLTLSDNEFLQYKRILKEFNIKPEYEL